MAETTIEWTDYTWNPWVGCKKVSAGCLNCYMYREQLKRGNDPKAGQAHQDLIRSLEMGEGSNQRRKEVHGIYLLLL